MQAFVIILGMPGIVQICRRDKREWHGRERRNRSMECLPLLLQWPRPQRDLESICHKTLEHGVLSHLDSRCTGLVQRCSQGPFPEFFPPPCLRFWGRSKLCKPPNSRIRARRGCFLSRLLQMGPQVNVQWETPDFSTTIFICFFIPMVALEKRMGRGKHSTW